MATAMTAAVPDEWLGAVIGADDQRLTALLQARPDLALPPPASLGDLAERVVSPSSVQAFHHGADRGTRQLLEAIAVTGPSVDVVGLAAALGCPHELLVPMVERLAAAGLLLGGDGGRFVANPALERAIPVPCRLGPPARVLLGSRPNSELVAINRRLGLSPNGAKPALTERIADALSDPARVKALLGGAPPGVEDLVETAALHWPVLQLSHPVEMMLRRAGGAPAWCLQRGLIVGAGYTTAVMPREVALAVRGGRLWPSFVPVPPPIPLREVDAAAVDRQAAEAALGVVADVGAICEAWSAVPAKPLQSGGVGVREVRKLAKVTGRPEDATARLVQLAHVAGLLDADADAVAPTERYDTWRALSGPARWAALAAAWLTLPLHLSLAGAREPDGKAVPPLAGLPLDLTAMVQRNLALTAVAEPGPARAADPTGVCRRLLWMKPSVWEDEGLASPAELVRWILAEAEMLGFTAAGALSGFGRLLFDGELAGAQSALTALAPPLVDQVILQADLTATVAGEPVAALRSELDLLADVESTGHATVWRFSEASLRRAFDSGRSASDIIGFLDRHAKLGVPQPLSYLVQDVGRRHGQVRLGPAQCYLRCADPSLLSEMQRSKKTARLHLRLLAPTVAVSDRPPSEVAEALRAAGHLPAEEAADGTMKVARPPARRIRARRVSRGAGTSTLPAGLLDADDDPDLDLLDELDLDLLDEDDVELGAELVSRLTGIPGDVLVSLARRDAHGSPSPLSEEGLADLVTRLRAVPPRRPAAPAPPSGKGSRPGHPPVGRLFGDDASAGRPNHIAKDPRSVTALLGEARDEGWAVRMSYGSSPGQAQELFAEVIDVWSGTVRLRFLDRPGGGELAIGRIQWMRVATEAEEDNLR